MKNMRERIEGLTQTIRQVLEVGDTIGWREICDEIKTRIYMTPEQKEITYGQPNFQHSVRRILSELVKRGEVIRVSRGKYKKA